MVHLKCSGIALAFLMLLAGCASGAKKSDQVAESQTSGSNGGVKARSSNSIAVVAEGDGRTRESAIEKALTTAANQAVGVLIIGTQQVINDHLISDEMFQQTAGIVNRYEIAYCSHEEQLHCQIKAEISTSVLMQAAHLTGDQTAEIDGRSEFA